MDHEKKSSRGEGFPSMHILQNEIGAINMSEITVKIHGKDQPNLSLGDQKNEVPERDASIIFRCDEKMPSAEVASEAEDNIKNGLQKRTQNSKVSVTSDKSSFSVEDHDIIVGGNSPLEQDVVEKCHESFPNIHKETSQPNIRRSLQILEKNAKTEENCHESLSCVSNNEIDNNPSNISEKDLLDNSMLSDVSEANNELEYLIKTRKSQIINNQINDAVNPKINYPLIDAEKHNLVLESSENPEDKLKSDIQNGSKAFLKEKSNAERPEKMKSKGSKSQSARCSIEKKTKEEKDVGMSVGDTRTSQKRKRSIEKNKAKAGHTESITLRRSERILQKNINVGDSSEKNNFIIPSGNCNIKQVKRKLVLESEGTSSESDKVIEKKTKGENGVGMRVGDTRTSQKRKINIEESKAKASHTENITLRRSERILQKNIKTLQDRFGLL